MRMKVIGAQIPRIIVEDIATPKGRFPKKYLNEIGSTVWGLWGFKGAGPDNKPLRLTVQRQGRGNMFVSSSQLGTGKTRVTFTLHRTDHPVGVGMCAVAHFRFEDNSRQKREVEILFPNATLAASLAAELESIS